MILLNNREHAWTPGMTVENLLKMNNYIFQDIIIKINGEYISPELYAQTPIHDMDEVLAIHIFGGG